MVSIFLLLNILKKKTHTLLMLLMQTWLLLVENNLDQVVINFKKEVVKKKNKCVVKNKARLKNFYTCLKTVPAARFATLLLYYFIPILVIFYTESFLLPGFLLTLAVSYSGSHLFFFLVSVLVFCAEFPLLPCSIPIFVFCVGSSLLPCFVSIFIFCYRSLTFLLLYLISISAIFCLKFIAFLLLCFVLSLAFYLRSLLFKIFKQSLSNKP